MPMNFELTISGLCVIVLKSQEDQPAHPTAVDILCVGDHHGQHHPRLSYRAEEVIASVDADLVIDPGGSRIASLDIGSKVLSLDLGENPHTQFSLEWGPEDAIVPGEERWMNWVPPVQFLGLEGIRLAGTGELPEGAGARLTLEPGTLAARSVILAPGTRNHVVWEYPAVQKTRALANEVVYRATGVQHVSLQWDGGSLFSSQENHTLQMSISNDFRVVRPDNSRGITRLEHLKHVGHLAQPPARVHVPSIDTSNGVQRTGHPICNQLVFIDKSL